MLTKSVRHGLLLDFYGPLLTDQQREVLVRYFEEDLSLSEIAEERGVSRAAVHDLIRRGLGALESYEERLGLVARYELDRRSLRQVLARVEEALTGSGGERRALGEVRDFLQGALARGEWPLD
jgi:hypothetical protein